jgi:hypothetical protein
MAESNSNERLSDRNLGDEWLDWDGSLTEISAETSYRVFLILSTLATIALIGGAGFFLWLIFPRLKEISSILPGLSLTLYYVISGILIIWLIVFSISVLIKKPLLSRWIVVPELVNKLLSIVIRIGKMIGVSPDRLTNSFLKVHNLFLGSRRHLIKPENLLVLLPRCLTGETFKSLRELKARYKFNMTTVGGGNAARKKIKELRPKLIIAVACERDLMSGFREVNTQIPVIGFPNQRPEGPCKNTCVDLNEIEKTIVRCLN